MFTCAGEKERLENYGNLTSGKKEVESKEGVGVE